jgi:hypothetical protein
MWFSEVVLLRKDVDHNDYGSFFQTLGNARLRTCLEPGNATICVVWYMLNSARVVDLPEKSNRDWLSENFWGEVDIRPSDTQYSPDRFSPGQTLDS